MQRLMHKLTCFLLLLGLLPVQASAAGGIVLTFDDWYVDQWHSFFTELKQTNPEVDIHVTFFAAKWLTDFKGAAQNNDDYIKLKQLEDAGHEIGSHSLNHIGVDEPPYSYQASMANQYYTDEVASSLTVMAAGDPDVANDYGFIPKSFSYPYGARTSAYDKVIKDNGLRYLRGTVEKDPNKPLSATDEIYHRSSGVYPYLLGDGLDKFYQNDLPEVEAALTRARDNDEIITLYAHRILPDGGEDHNFGIYASKLKAIILKAHSLGLKFYKFSESFQEGTTTGGGGNGNADKITVTVEANNRVRLSWTDLPNNLVEIAPANQTDMAVASAVTSGNATDKMGITVANAQAGQEYVALFYLNNIKVATSNPFMIVAGSTTVAAPTNLTATAVSTTQVNLGWTDNSNNETGFRVGRCTGATCSNFVDIGTVGAGVTSYTDNTVQAATSYRYRVVAYNGTTNSTSYPVAAVTTPSTPITLVAPTNLLASVVSGNQVKLEWADNSTGEDGFKVERCLGETCTNFAVVKSTTANVTTFTNTGLSTNAVYRYRVRAFKGTAYSDYTATVIARTLAKPTNLTTSALVGGQVKLTWADTNSYETGFKIERCAGSSCVNFVEVASVGANTLTFTDSGLQAGTYYRYQIRAFHEAGYSAYSARSRVLAK